MTQFDIANNDSINNSHDAWVRLRTLKHCIHDNLDSQNDMLCFSDRESTEQVLKEQGFEDESLEIGIQYLIGVYHILKPLVQSYRDPYERFMDSPLGMLTKIPLFGDKIKKGYLRYLLGINFPEELTAGVGLRKLQGECRSKLDDLYAE